MAQALSQSIQLKLDQALQQWQQWQGPGAPVSRPSFQRALSGGHSNHSLLVADEAGTRFVVRIDGINPVTTGLNRRVEWKVLHHAAASGIGPRPRYFNPELGCLVCDYLDGRRAATFNAGPVAELLRAVHALPAVHARLNLEERLLRYARQATVAGELQAQVEAMTRWGVACCRVLADKATLCLCHNDLLAGNRLQQDRRIRALDWEYACMADPLYDLAVIAVGDELSPGQANDLLLAYGATGSESRDRFEKFCLLYRCLEVLWYLALPVSEERGRWQAQQLPRKLAALDTLGVTTEK